MDVGTTMPAACYAVMAQPSDDPTAPSAKVDRQLTHRDAHELLLVVGTVAVTLGLVAIVVSLMSSWGGMADSEQHWPRSALAREMATAMPPRSNGHPLVPPVIPRDLADDPAPAALLAVRSTGPWASPLYPQNGVTLWDRIRVSTGRDRRDFLLGIAIQLHAPATAALVRSAVPAAEIPEHYRYLQGAEAVVRHAGSEPPDDQTRTDSRRNAPASIGRASPPKASPPHQSPSDR